MNLWLAGALAAILLLAGFAWRLRPGRDRKIGSPEEAADAADQALPGFVTGGAVVGADGMAALAVDRRGERLAVAKRRGALIVVLEVGWAQVVATPKGIVVETGERRFGGRIAVTGVDQLDMRRLATQSTRV